MNKSILNKSIIFGAALALLMGMAEAQDRTGANQAIQNAGGSHNNDDSSTLFNQAIDDYNAKRYTAAADELRETLKRDQGNVQAHQMLADIDIRQNKIAEAIPDMEAIVKLTPKDARWRDNLGTAYLQTSQFDKAAAFYKNAHDRSPKEADLAYYWGLSLGQAGRYAEAVPALQSALALKPTAPAYLQLGVALDKSGKQAEAAAAFQAASALEPKNAQAFLYTGVLYHQTGDDAKAIPALRQALALGTDDPFAAHVTLAGAYAAMKDTDKAIQEFSLASTARPDDFGALANLGVLSQSAGKSAEAEAAYRKALALKSGGPKAHASVGSNLALLLTSQGKLEEAVALLTQAAADDPANAHTMYNLGVVYEKQGKKDLAVAAYRKALALDPALKEAQQNLDQIQK